MSRVRQNLSIQLAERNVILFGTGSPVLAIVPSLPWRREAGRRPLGDAGAEATRESKLEV